MPQLRPHFEKVDSQIQKRSISPTGARAVFEAHGEIFTVPAEKGDVRNITNSPTVADRFPAWSPDGKSIAYFSDETGEYPLHISPQNSLGPVTKIDLGRPTFYSSLKWSPDSKKLTYHDERLNLWYIDVEKKTPVHVDTGDMRHRTSSTHGPLTAGGSTYCKELDNHMHAIYVYSLETGNSTQITDGMSDALSPKFDKDGKYLYFTASTDEGLVAGGDMSAFDHPVTRSVYVVVLKKGVASPIAPESDEEKGDKKPDADSAKDKPGAASADKPKEGAESKEKKKPAEPAKVEIDFDGIRQRILAMPIPPKNYFGLLSGKEGEIFLVEIPPAFPVHGEFGQTVYKFTLKDRKLDKLVDGIMGFSFSFDGEKMLYRKGQAWFINPTSAPPAPGKGQLKTAGMEVYVNPREEWKQIYHEVWRIERDFFYDPHFHGLDLQQAEKAFAPYLDNVASREDLNYLFREMLSYMSVGHMFVGGGTQPQTLRVTVGLLGAEYAIENGRYRFGHVYDGENWNPNLRAPPYPAGSGCEGR